MFGFGFGLAATRILIASFQYENRRACTSDASGLRSKKRWTKPVSRPRSARQGTRLGANGASPSIHPELNLQPSTHDHGILNGVLNSNHRQFLASFGHNQIKLLQFGPIDSPAHT